MPNRQLIVTELDPNEPDYGGLFAIDPANASGIGLPTARIVTSVPPVGQVAGEVIVNTTTNTAFVWTGNSWAPLAPTSITSYPTEVQLRGDSPADGLYAFARDTGNLFVRVNGQWKMQGIPIFDTEATLLQDTSSATGQVAFAIDTNNGFVRTSTGWARISINHFANIAELQADTHAIEGSLAVTLDNGDLYVFNQGQYQRLNGQRVVIGAAQPTNPTAGTIFYNPATPGQVQIHDGTQWDSIGGVPTGTILMWPTDTPPPGYQLCDGTAAATPELLAVVGSSVPDLRGQFIRGWGATTGPSSGQNILTTHQDTTRAPRTAFSVSNAGGHKHTIKKLINGWSQAENSDASANWDAISAGYAKNAGRAWFEYNGTDRPINTAGAHTHSITGGDPETAPSHILLAYIIKT